MQLVVGTQCIENTPGRFLGGHFIQGSLHWEASLRLIIMRSQASYTGYIGHCQLIHKGCIAERYPVSHAVRFQGADGSVNN